MIRAAAIALTLLLPVHDQWSNGSPVPAWIKQYCCGPDDIHHYRGDQVRVTPEGFILPDYPDAVPFEKALPSMDGDYWAFFKVYPGGGMTSVICFFAPPGST